MGKVFVFLLLLLIAAGLWLHRTRTLRADEPIPPEPAGPERVARARAAVEARLARRCKTAGLPYPPRELFLRAFKREAELEAWGREDGGAFRQIATYRIQAASGGPGPKRVQGDLQVPEGFYEIDLWNPESRFRLSLRVNYPNAADRVLSDPERPGDDIYIHGNNVSIGCLAMGDEAIDELFILALDVRDRGQARIPIHLFPMRMRGADWVTWQAQHPALADFWAQLQPGFDAFERTKRVPRVTVAADGSYRVAAE